MIKLLAVDDEPGICDILNKTFSPIGFAKEKPKSLVRFLPFLDSCE